jgi:hypothetical protein
MLYENKSILSNFGMKDLGDAFYVLGSEIRRHKSKIIFRLSQNTYIDRVLKRYNMHKCPSSPGPVDKGNKLGTF